MNAKSKTTTFIILVIISISTYKFISDYREFKHYLIKNETFIRFKYHNYNETLCTKFETLPVDYQHLGKLYCQIKSRADLMIYLNALRPRLKEISHSYAMFSGLMSPAPGMLTKEDIILQYQFLRQNISSEDEPMNSLILSNFAFSFCKNQNIEDILTEFKNIKNIYNATRVTTILKECYLSKLIKEEYFIDDLRIHIQALEDKSSQLPHVKMASTIFYYIPSFAIKKIIYIVTKGTPFEREQQREEIYYYDEISQLSYLLQEWEDVIKNSKEVQKRIEHESINNFRTIKIINISRIGKALIEIEDFKGAEEKLNEIIENSHYLKGMNRWYYPDVSLVNKFIKHGKKATALNFLKGLLDNGHIEEKLYNMTLKKIDKPDFSIEYEFYKYYYELKDSDVPKENVILLEE